MIRTVLKLAVVGAFVYAAWHVSPVYLHYVTFKDEVAQTARFGGARPEHEIVDRVMAVAGELQIPLTREAVRVRQESNHTFIDASYTEHLRLLPRVTYPWTFKISAEGWLVRPVTADDVMGR